MKDEILEFDDSQAIEFIKKHLPDEQKTLINEDAIQYVLDLICEYYEENGLMNEEDVAEESEIAEDDMFNYIFAFVKKDKIFELSGEQLQLILDGEYAYGRSIGIYSEE
jgi:hypothetical protein